ncbi:MAG: type IVB secretion system protein IcmJDotN [Legionellales bacterium]|jgi:intracellular multiplication protein IcmJ
MHPLTLSANLDGWRLFKARRKQSAFQKIAQKVFIRDKYQCQYCGFRDLVHQEVANINGNYRQNEMSNLATCCALCMECNFLGVLGREDRIIYFPQMSQADLMHSVRVLFCLIASKTPYVETAKSLYRNLRQLMQPVDEIFGKDASISDLFGQSLLDTQNMGRDVQKKVMLPLRLLPNQQNFSEQILHWSTIILPKLEANDLSMDDF